MRCQKSPSFVHMEPSKVMEKMRQAGYDTTPRMKSDPSLIENSSGHHIQADHK
jgi:hypothetical protein